MIRTQIYIPETIHQETKLLAKRKKEPMAELLRRFIIKGVKEEKRKIKPKSLDSLINLKITGGPKNLSRDMDKYLYGK